MVKHVSRLMVVLGALLAAMIVPTASAQSGQAMVRVIHASPDAPAVDVFVDGNRVLTNVPFFTASDYLPLPAGEHRFQVAPTGQSASAAVIDATATVEAGRAYSVAATGLVANITATITNDNLAAPAAGKAHVRVYHFSPDAPAVDIKVANGPTLISNLAFPSASDYLPVDAGSYNIQVTPTGQSTVVIDLPNTALEAGRIYDVFANGQVGNNTLKATVATPAPMTAGAPSTLPVTSGESTSVAVFGLLAAILIAGGLVLRRQVR